MKNTLCTWVWLLSFKIVLRSVASSPLPRWRLVPVSPQFLPYELDFLTLIGEEQKLAGWQRRPKKKKKKNCFARFIHMGVCLYFVFILKKESEKTQCGFPKYFLKYSTLPLGLAFLYFSLLFRVYCSLFPSGPMVFHPKLSFKFSFSKKHGFQCLKNLLSRLWILVHSDILYIWHKI